MTTLVQRSRVFLASANRRKATVFLAIALCGLNIDASAGSRTICGTTVNEFSYTGTFPSWFDETAEIYGPGFGTSTFLGQVSSNEFAANSILNQFGLYGSQFATNSIFNSFGLWGSAFQISGVCNTFGGASSVPRIVRNGVIVGYVTKNSFVSGGIDPATLVAALLRKAYLTAPIGPAAPSLVAPANLAALTGTTVTLTWSPVNGAAAYDVWLRFGSPAVSVPISLQTGTSVTVRLTPGITYRWDVASCINTSSNSTANCPNVSATREFTLGASQPPPAAPSLVTPANLAALTGTTVTLTWSAVNGAAAYNVLLKYGSPAVTVPVSLQTGTSVTLNSLLPGVYSWNVASCIDTSSNSPANCPNFSETRGFTLAASQSVTAAPNLVSPPDQAVISGSSVDFSWSSVAGAAGYSFYIYNRTTNTDVLSPAIPPTQTSTGFGVSNLGPGIYSWNVASCLSLAAYSSTNCPNLSVTRTIRSLSGPLQLSRRGGIDIDGNNKSAIVVRSASAQLQAGRLVNNQFQFSALQDPGPSYRLVGVGDFFRSGKSDLAFQNMTQGTLGDIRIWRNFSASNEVFWRQVRQVWDVQATGDLDGDGFGDLVWRYVVTESPDTGVSYIWFTNGSTVTQVRKRGGAPLDWTLLGAADLNGDGAADMVYINPSNQARALMATANRTCANVSIGNIPTNLAALRMADFTGNGRGDILLRDKSTGAVSLLRLNAAGLTLPPFTGSPDDQNASCTGSTLQVASTTLPILNADPAWQFYASGDFNGDGIVDIVWKQTNGTLTLWLMNAEGVAPTVIQNAGVAPAGFTVFQNGGPN